MYASEEAVLNAQYNAAVLEQMGAEQRMRPAVLYRPGLCIDGNQWCALYGEDLQSGVAGFGDSPAEAMADFDANWNAKLQQRIAA
ncbi:hypothetical protein GO299_04707 [Ralstonia solanacearum]|nr:hypothetical protein [Ralstonia solanacearum]NKF72420.1 hypothetical protein [Ralstonia solanacearum]